MPAETEDETAINPAEEILRLRDECPFTESDLLAPILHVSDAGADWIDRGTYPTYWAVGAYLQPATVAEVGVRYGYSLHSMLKGSGKVQYAVGFDNEYDFAGSNDYALSKLPLKTSIVNVDTQKAESLNLARKVDLFHVDATHSEDGTFRECQLAWKWVKPGGHLLVDDVLADTVKAGVERFCAEVIATGVFIPCYRGLQLIQKPK